ncbi:uncharacterized protein CDV56_109154 [Aspergillus thermomutatus]|uniref:Transposase MuDR plant domain-containing protein n=1 Tax=Aspergillus thermomutatus TaxID=41047 RepID=A0A397I1R3_ASPTH|nr:uncharacterized protein CDV56_109154 [Aspergillus thermomutatus]RHZ67736.1 hypothetical protein CDV56_109154 [Aspergillus thermomutatus]
MTEMYSGLHVGQQFVSLEEFKSVVRSISVRQHWELRVARSNKKSVVIGCRSSANCYFRVVCRANKNETYITSLQDSHSCRQHAASPGTTPARSEASHVRFLLNEIPKLFDLSHKIKGQDVVDAVKRYHGYDISIRQAHRALTKLQPRLPRNQNEESQDRGFNGDDQPGPRVNATPSVNGSVYSAISEQRWITDNVHQSEFLEKRPIEPTDDPRNGSPQPAELARNAVQLQPPSQRPQPVHRSSQVQLPPGAQPQEQIALSHGLRPTDEQQSDYILSAPTVLSAPQTEPSQSPQQPRSSGHPSAPQMILTNFKIEFTCTACGALNQSFIPNQGNMTGAAYLASNNVTSQGPVGRTTSSSMQSGASGVERVAETHEYVEAPSVNARGIQPPWQPGSLPVSIPPAHT